MVPGYYWMRQPDSFGRPYDSLVNVYKALPPRCRNMATPAVLCVSGSSMTPMLVSKLPEGTTFGAKIENNLPSLAIGNGNGGYVKIGGPS
jgi:hypothetical protein